MAPCPVRLMAQARGLPTLTPTRLRDGHFAAALSEMRPDLAVVAAYGRILTPTLLAIPRLGCLNLHASLLPRHRGASPIAHAILAGDPEIGVCLMQMEAGLDTGPVWARLVQPVPAAATTASLTLALAAAGADLLLAQLPALLAGSLIAEPQPATGATYAPLLRKEDGWLQFSQAAPLLVRQVRAFDPWPGTRIHLHGQPVAVLRAHAEAGPAAAAAGTVVLAGPQGVAVACAEGLIWLDEVRPAGRRPMSGAAWATGRGVAVGDHLAAPAAMAPK